MEKNNKNLNVPNLRFPEFSGEWDNGTLQSVATLSKGTGISKDQLSEEGHPCILYGELYTKYRSEIIDTIISKTDIDPKKLVRSQANDVIIPCSGESAVDIATARCVKQSNVLLGGDLNIIRLKGEHDGSFFAYQLNGKRKYDIAKVAQGVSVVHLYGEHLKGVKVNYPSAAEQKKTSSLLALIDQRIKTQKKIIEKYESLIKGIRCNLLKFDSSVRICKLKDICKITTGKLDANAMEEDGIYPFFTCAEEPFTINTYAFDTEALLVSGNGANVGYVNYCNGKFNAYQRTYVLYDFSVDIHYVRYYMDAFLKQRIDQEKNIGNTPYIVLSTLADMKICIPSPTRQQDICRIIKAIETKLTLEKGLYNSHQQVKDFLLRTMFI